jgi:ribosomal-protein-serine acetyltransferase
MPLIWNARMDAPVLILPVDDETQLRQLEPRDAVALFHLIDRSRPYLRQWLPWIDENGALADTQFFIADAILQRNRNEGLHTGLWHRGELAGVVGLHHIDWSNQSASIGYYLGEAYQGKGLMTQACRVLMAHAFDTLNLHRVEIRSAPGNLKSRAIAVRLGFVEDGRIREAAYINGRYVDLLIYSKLAAEYQAEQRQALRPAPLRS